MNGLTAEEQAGIAAHHCTDASDRERLSAAAEYLAGLRQGLGGAADGSPDWGVWLCLRRDGGRIARPASVGFCMHVSSLLFACFAFAYLAAPAQLRPPG